MSDDPNNKGREVLATNETTGEVMLAVSHDPCDAERAAYVRLDVMSATIWMGAGKAERTAMALLRFAAARRAAERQARTFPETETRH
jgi:hypothetical protein